MKIRVKFGKTGIMQYVGHLDILRFFQKAMRRAGLDIKYTEGMSPHPVLSFASPLGLGLTTRGDYFDTALETDRFAHEFISRLNAQMSDGMRVLAVAEIEEGRKQNAMASLTACGYEIRFSDADARLAAVSDDLQNKWRSFLNQPAVWVSKEQKSGIEETDILPLIYRSDAGNGLISMVISSGSANNLRPDTVMTAFLSFCGTGLDAAELLKDGEIFIERTEMYTGTAENGLKTLLEAGKIIEQI